MWRGLALFLLVSLPWARAGAAELEWKGTGGRQLLGPALDGPWFDHLRGLFFVIESTGAGYRVSPILLDRIADGQPVNRFEGLVLQGKLEKGQLEFRGEDRPTADPSRLAWRIQGAVRRAALDRLEGTVRIDHAPFPVPALPMQRLVLRRYDRSPTLSVFRHGAPRKGRQPASIEVGGMGVRVDVERLPKKTDVPQADAADRLDIEPRTRRLTTRGKETWTFDREAAW